MKKLFLLVPLILPISIFSMDDDEQLNARMDALFAGLRKNSSGAVLSASSDTVRASDRRATEILAASPVPLFEQVAKRSAADIVGSSFSSVTIDENELMERARQQQALIVANVVEMSKDLSEDVYVRILGENFDLIEDDMSADELDRRITQLWNKESEDIKRKALAAIERVNNNGFLDTLLTSMFPRELKPSDEQKTVMLHVVNNSIREFVENTNTVSMLKMRIDYMRKVVAVHRTTLAKAQASSSGSSSTHHTIQ